MMREGGKQKAKQRLLTPIHLMFRPMPEAQPPPGAGKIIQRVEKVL
jgi:hypothetical protein